MFLVDFIGVIFSWILFGEVWILIVFEVFILVFNDWGIGDVVDLRYFRWILEGVFFFGGIGVFEDVLFEIFVWDDLFFIVVLFFIFVFRDFLEISVMFFLVEGWFWWFFLDCRILLLWSWEVRYVIVFDFFLSFFNIVIRLDFFLDKFLIYFWFSF